MFQFSCKIKIPILFQNVYRICTCRYSNKELNTKMKVLNVAEKNDAAKNIAGHLSGGNLQRVIFEYIFNFRMFSSLLFYFI